MGKLQGRQPVAIPVERDQSTDYRDLELLAARGADRLTETVASTLGGDEENTGVVSPSWGEPRARKLLLRTQQVTAAAAMMLGLTVLIAVLRAPQDLLIFVQVVAALLLLAGMGSRHVIIRRLAERHAAREAGITRMLQGMSRSASAEAIVQAIVDELRRTANADHVLAARLRPVDRVVETTLVSTRASMPQSRSVLPYSVLDPSRVPASRRGPGRRGRGADQLVADDIARRLAETYGLSNTLAAPLVAGKRTVGALVLSRRQARPWTLADRRLLSWSAGELSAALARAYAFEAAEVRAYIDALTGLPNRRYLEELLATMGPRRRSGDQLAALMIDLDHFKELNDRYGHVIGDRVLRAVGECLADAVRAEDTAARYGGEEFAIVLARPDPADAVEVGERIRRLIAEIPPEDVGILEPISVSIGVAVAGPHVSDAYAVLDAADRALYRAKREGRNRVALAR